MGSWPCTASSDIDFLGRPPACPPHSRSKTPISLLRSSVDAPKSDPVHRPTSPDAGGGWSGELLTIASSPRESSWSTLFGRYRFIQVNVR
jgi:hypothetical protein